MFSRLVRWAAMLAACAVLAPNAARAQAAWPANVTLPKQLFLSATQLEAESCNELRQHYRIPDFPRNASADVGTASSERPALEVGCQEFQNLFLAGRSQGVAHIDRSVRITEACTFRGTSIVITAPNVSLDCGGSTFVGSKKLMRGLSLRVNTETSTTPGSQLQPIDQVQVSRCNFSRFRFGIHLSNALNRYNRQDAQLYDRILTGMFEQGRWDTPGRSSPADQLRALSPKNVRLSHLTVSDAKVGIYVHDHMVGVDVSHVTVRGARVGVYLDHGSRQATIRNSCFLEPRGRESVAIDASAGNLVAGNLFYLNPKGAVALYKNCSENIDAPHQFYRRQWSIGNRVTHNAIISRRREASPRASIEIGSRQWQASRRKRDCGDVPRNGSKGARMPDYAQFNLVDSNLFVTGGTGLRINDDSNAARANLFVVDERFRAPVIVIGNQFDLEYRGRGVASVETSANSLSTTASPNQRTPLGPKRVRIHYPNTTHGTRPKP